MIEEQNITTWIQEEVDNHKIVLFMKGTPSAPQCGFSARIADILNSLELDYVAHDVLQSDILRSGIKEFTNWPTIPQLYINGEFVGGCDIITEMYQAGELKELVK